MLLTPSSTYLHIISGRHIPLNNKTNVSCVGISSGEFRVRLNLHRLLSLVAVHYTDLASSVQFSYSNRDPPHIRGQRRRRQLTLSGSEFKGAVRINPLFCLSVCLPVWLHSSSPYDQTCFSHYLNCDRPEEVSSCLVALTRRSRRREVEEWLQIQ